MRPGTSRLRPAAALRRSAALLLAGLACAGGPRPLTGEDTLGGVRALDTSYRVKDALRVPGPEGREYLLPVGEYHPKHADAEGFLYAAPTGVTERAGFSRRNLQGGVWVENAPGRPYLRPALWVDRGDGKLRRFPLPASALSRYGDALVFAVGGQEQVP